MHKSAMASLKGKSIFSLFLCFKSTYMYPHTYTHMYSSSQNGFTGMSKILVTGAYEYVTFYGKRIFAGMIKVTDLK
jgi:hypothetical protein